MLSGRPPFLALRVHEDSASMIMSRIKNGEFRMDDDVWRNVSTLGKSIVKGLLTVDPKRRLKLEDLIHSPWISQQPHHHHFSQFNNNPISSLFLQQHAPKQSVNRVDRQLKQTFNAFHSVAREGGLSQLTAPPHIIVNKLHVPSTLPSLQSSSSSSRRHLKSSTVSSTASSSTSSSSNGSISISILAQHAAAVAAHPAAFLFQPNFSSSQMAVASPFIGEALQSVSNHILPSQIGHYPLINATGSAYGPMTRLRKRKMAERSSPDEKPFFLQSGMSSAHSMTPYLGSFETQDQKKKIKTETILTSTSMSMSPSSNGSYFSVSVTRVPNAAHNMLNPCSTIPRTFKTTRTPTITID